MFGGRWNVKRPSFRLLIFWAAKAAELPPHDHRYGPRLVQPSILLSKVHQRPIRFITGAVCARIRSLGAARRTPVSSRRTGSPRSPRLARVLTRSPELIVDFSTNCRLSGDPVETARHRARLHALTFVETRQEQSVRRSLGHRDDRPRLATNRASGTKVTALHDSSRKADSVPDATASRRMFAG